MRIRSKHIVALDIQDRCVKCIQLRYSSGTWSIRKNASKEIPRSEIDEDASHYTQTAHVIKSLLQEMNIYPPKNLVTCISGRDAAVRLLNLPPVRDRKAKEIEEMVKYELMMQLPVNMEQMGFDYQIVKMDDEGTRILTAAAKRSILNRHLRLLSLAGVYPDLVTTSSFMLFNAFVGKEPESIRDGKVGLVYLRDSHGDVLVCEDGIPVYARSFSLQIIASKEQLVREIHNSFDTYSRTRADNSDDEEKGDIPVIYLLTEEDDLPAGLTDEDLLNVMPEAHWIAQQAGDDPVIGLALAGMRSTPKSTHPSTLRVNLLRQIVHERRIAENKAVKARLLRIAPAITAFTLMVISGLLWWQVYRAEGKIHSLESNRQASAGKAEYASKLSGMEEALQKQVESISWAVDKHPMISHRLYEITLAMPDSLWLKEVYIPEKMPGRKKKQEEHTSKLYVVGYAHKQSQIVEFVGNLEKCDCFSEVKQENTSEVRVAGETVLEFKISLASPSN